MTETTLRDRLLDRWPFRGPASRRPRVAVVRLNGVIGSFFIRPGGLTLAGQEEAIARAFRMRGVKAVALVINSPGGSPVQSSLIAGRVRALAAETGIPVLAFCEDVAASGGYWLACAGDEIFAHEASIVGSIGVISTGFGLSDFIARFGIERRVYTAGERKSQLDPFKPEDPAEVARLQAVQADLHQAFIAAVKTSRGDRLKGDPAALFSGEFWSAPRARELGLVDELGDLRGVLQARFGEKVVLRRVGVRRPWWRWRPPFSARRGDGTADSGGFDAGTWAWSLLAAVEERGYWGRYGL